jgi:uncharacterized protein
MRILGIMVTMMFLCLKLASAATIDLNDGSSIQGDIVKQDNKSIQINVDGVTMTYYADEIKDIDGKPFAASAPADQPEAAAPATQPDAAAQSETTVPAEQPEAAAQPEVAAPAPEAQSSGTIDPEKRALILKFIDVFGTRQALTNNFDLMIKQIEKEKPDEAQKIRERVKVDEIIERLLPIYDRNFTSDDLKAFIDFYGSPEGQKLIGTIPELMKESVQESVKYMEEKFPEVKQQ